MKKIIAIKTNYEELFFIGQDINNKELEELVLKTENEIKEWYDEFKLYLKNLDIDLMVHDDEYNRLCNLSKEHNANQFFNKMFDKHAEKDKLICEYKSMRKNPIFYFDKKLKKIGFEKINLKNVDMVIKLDLRPDKEKIELLN
jgi:hypothetical protein